MPPVLELPAASSKACRMHRNFPSRLDRYRYRVRHGVVHGVHGLVDAEDPDLACFCLMGEDREDRYVRINDYSTHTV